MKPERGETEGAGRDDFEIGGVENQRPPAQVEVGSNIIDRVVDIPAADTVGIHHAIEGVVTGGRAFFGDLFFGLGDEGGIEFITDPIQGATGCDRRFGRALETERLVCSFDKIVPRIVLENAFEGGGRELEVDRFAPHGISKRGVLQIFANLAHVPDAIAQIGLVTNEVQAFGVIDVGQLGPDSSEARVLEVATDTRDIGRIEEEAGGLGGRAVGRKARPTFGSVEVGEWQGRSYRGGRLEEVTSG